MRSFYATKISPNLSRSEGENYLIATACNVARTGIQKYRADEIGLEGTELIDVYRSPEEVFSRDTLASLNGKCITEFHPESFLNSQNTSELQRGFCMNPRRGGRTEEGDDLLIADLVITDEATIQKVLGGLMRELSVGYQCLYRQDANNRWCQVQIICNHLAIVPSGRAGAEVRIKDHAIETQDLAAAVKDSAAIRIEPEVRVEAPAIKPQKEKVHMPAKTGILSRMLKKFAADAEPEELEEAIDFAAKASVRAEHQAGDAEAEKAEEEKKAKDAKDRKAKDAEEEKERMKKEEEEKDKKAKDARDAKDAADKKAKDAEESEKAEKEKEAKDAADKKAKDAKEESAGMQLHPELKEHIGHMRDCMDAIMEHLGVEGPKGKSEDADLIPVTVEAEADRPKNPITGADSNDSVKAFLKLQRPHIAKSNDAAAKTAWNDAWKAASGSTAGTKTGTDGYTALIHRGRPAEAGMRNATDMSVEERSKELEKATDELDNAFAIHRKRLMGGK